MKKNAFLYTLLGCLFLCLITSAAAFSQTPHFQRTPNSEKFDVVYLRCEWNVDPSEAEMSGKITYYFEAKENLEDQIIYFNLSDNMDVDAVTKEGQDIPFTHKNNLIEIDLSDMLSPDLLDSLTIVYHGVPKSTGLGSYTRSTHSGIPVVWTLSTPYGAEDWFPCKNDLRDKTDSLDVFIITPEGNLAASNGKLLSITPTEDGKLLHHWRHNYPIVTYLICFSVTNYETYSDWYHWNDTDSLEILNYIYPESLAGVRTKTPAVLQAIEIFERMFGTYPYPDEKYGHAQFGWSGGMEHQTMSFMGSWTDDFLAHELSHQWFGNMITCGSWGDIWINEGFATYCTALYLEEISPSRWTSWKTQTISNVVSKKDGSVYCADTTSANQIFDSRLTYDKGALVLHMARWILGDERFFQGMWNFANDPDLRYGFAVTEDIKRHFEAVSGEDMTEFFDHWVYRQGYPAYKITATQKEDFELTLLLEQTPSHESVDCFKMPVEIQFKGEDRDSTILIYNDQLTQTFTVNPEFQVYDIVIDPNRRLLARRRVEWVGIDDQKEENGWINLYPNPAGNQITLQINKPNRANWSLYDASGKKVNSGKINKEDIEIHINSSDLDNGVYVLKLQSGRKSISKKVIIVK
ncbi:T9SS type A sorting domain-containing protein [Bacteroidales bacterium OttesenSCG-928-J16]|nr:T9SS type A sorting domain-containing protein [Bacteroidales bacterium OttesenSCG-928-J16]